MLTGSGATVAAVALIAGCGSGGQPAGQAADEVSAPRSGGTLRVATSATTTCIDPAQTLSGNSSQLIRPLVDSLTYQDPRTGVIKPWLAASWQVSSDAKRFTFHLRPGVTFSDGAVLNAAAVKTSFDEIAAQGAGAATAASYLAGYQGATAVDADTVRIDFGAPNEAFLQATSTTALAPLSPASWRTPAVQRCQGKFAGAGPFVLKAFTQGRQVKLSARSGYAWGAAGWHAGAAYLSELDFEAISESGVEADSLASGQVQVATGLAAQDQKRFTGSGFSQFAVLSPGMVYSLTPNTGRTVLADQNVRLALLKGTDRAQLVDTALGKAFKPASGVLARSTPGYLDQSAALAYDPAGAKKLLDDAGWEPGSGGIRSKNGTRLSINVTYPSIDTIDSPALELLQQQWRTIGVDLKLRGLPITQLSPDQDAGDYDLLAFSQTRADGDVLRTVFSTQAKNRARLPAGAGLDTQLAQQNRTSDTAQRNGILAAIQRDILDLGYTVPLYEYGSLVATSGAVHDYSLDGSFHDTWLSS